MAIDPKVLLELELKQKNSIKLTKDEKQLLKENSKEEQAKKAKMSFGERMLKSCKAPYSQLMGDLEVDNFPIRDWIDTGNILLNAQISADGRKGMPSGRVWQLAGESSVGKTYLGLETLKNAQKDLGYFGVLYDSEMANNDKEALKARGINTENLLYIPIDTVENLKTSMLNIIEEADVTDKIFIMVDSIGNLSTRKELEDSLEGSATKDMTRPAQLKALFRTVTIKAGVKNIPVIAINHTYACGTKNMIIRMSDNSLKSLCDVNSGDYVKTLIGDKEVLGTVKYNNAQVIKLTLDDGSILEFTPNHKLMVKCDEGFIWKEIIDLKENDTIITT